MKDGITPFETKMSRSSHYRHEVNLFKYIESWRGDKFHCDTLRKHLCNNSKRKTLRTHRTGK